MEKQFYNFVKEVYDKQLGVEGIAIADGEKILMEHHFTPDQARNIYSHTKSYMSTAVGLAIADGKLSLDDRLAEFFPEAVPENAQPELFEIRLRHLLMMSSGFHEPYLMGANRRAGVGAPDYVKYMLSRPVKVQPWAANSSIQRQTAFWQAVWWKRQWENGFQSICMSAFLNPSDRAFRSGKTVLRDIRSVAAACS